MLGKTLQAILLLSFLLHGLPSYSLPLSTNKRWIVDQLTGERVKLACVNWPSHVEPMLAEGLDKQPVGFIAFEIVKYQFNCVRFTFSTQMFTRDQYSNLTIEESFDRLNLTEAKAGLVKHNPFLLRMTIPQAYETVVDVLGAHGLMVIADNHISQPIWCCSDNDQNGFPNDKEFPPDEWIRGLTIVAKQFYGKSQVIGIGLRNEPRGPRQNVPDWYQYIYEAATKVHETNPDLLLVASGLSYATDLTFLKTKPLAFNFDNKLVLETHLYAFSNGLGNIWRNQSLNNACDSRMKRLYNDDAFVIDGDNPVPLFFGEFGLNQKDVNPAEDRFLSCFSAYLAEKDLDWGFWALQGSYYFREKRPGTEETYGILNFEWNGLRNPSINRRLQLLKTKNQGVDTDAPGSYIMYHPKSGSCLGAFGRSIYPGMCKGLSRWLHDGDDAPIRLMGTDLCLKASGEGEAPFLSADCFSQQSRWRSLSNSKLHLAAKDGNGEYTCLQMESSELMYPRIVTRKCICVGVDPNCLDDPTSQWVKLVLTNVI